MCNQRPPRSLRHPKKKAGVVALAQSDNMEETVSDDRKKRTTYTPARSSQILVCKTRFSESMSLIWCTLQELTNEQCEILELPYGTKIVGEMDEFMIERLTKRGTYEGSAGLRYFGNEKFRKKNYFGKQKLVLNDKRSRTKYRRAEIETRMDAGIKYEDAGVCMCVYLCNMSADILFRFAFLRWFAQGMIVQTLHIHTDTRVRSLETPHTH